ncbi:MAG: SAV_6107 family HEPN domain-containing protein [Candidatus Nanopelagicales bacterium]|nr:SAV_6107 family HEPN domain-containing protein [Candidatus Nanopelagicales bacterium]
MRAPVTQIPAASLELLAAAVSEVEAAMVEPKPAARYVRAQLGALRAAAAVLAAGARPGGGQGPRNVWSVLPTVAPELVEWSMFFAAGAGKQAAILAGLDHVVTAREADDLVRECHHFLNIVAATLDPGVSSVVRSVAG